MTLFRSAAAAAAGVIDAVFAEPFVFLPMTHAAGRWSADPDRSEATGPAILAEIATFNQPLGERAGSGMSKGLVSDVSASDAKIEVRKALLGYALKTKDRLRRVSDGALFEVSGVLQDDLDHAVYRVVRLGSAP